MFNNVSFSDFIKWFESCSSDNQAATKSRESIVDDLRMRIKRNPIETTVNRRIQLVDIDNKVEWQLPLDVFRLVLGFVSPKEYAEVSSVSKYWKYACLECVTERETLRLKNVEDFFSIPKSIDLSYSGSLSELSEYLRVVRSKIAAGVSVKNLQALEVPFALIEKPIRFEGLLILIEIQKKLLTIPNQERYIVDLRDFIRAFINLGETEKAFEVLEKMEKVDITPYYFEVYDSALLRLFDVVKDDGLVSLMKLPSSKFTAVAKYFLCGMVDKGNALAKTLNEESKAKIFPVLPFMQSIANGDYADLVWLETKANEKFISAFLKEVISRLIKEGRYPDIEKQVSSMKHIKNDVMAMHAYRLISDDRFEEAKKVIESLRMDQVDEELIFEIVVLLCEKGKFDMARYVKTLYTLLEEISITFETTISVFETAEKGDFEEVFENYYFLSIIDGALHSIITKMVKAGKREDAIKLALKIENLTIRHETLRWIWHV